MKKSLPQLPSISSRSSAAANTSTPNKTTTTTTTSSSSATTKQQQQQAQPRRLSSFAQPTASASAKSRGGSFRNDSASLQRHQHNSSGGGGSGDMGSKQVDEYEVSSTSSEGSSADSFTRYDPKPPRNTTSFGRTSSLVDRAATRRSTEAFPLQYNHQSNSNKGDQQGDGEGGATMGRIQRSHSQGSALDLIRMRRSSDRIDQRIVNLTQDDIKERELLWKQMQQERAGKHGARQSRARVMFLQGGENTNTTAVDSAGSSADVSPSDAHLATSGTQNPKFSLSGSASLGGSVGGGHRESKVIVRNQIHQDEYEQMLQKSIDRKQHDPELVRKKRWLEMVSLALSFRLFRVRGIGTLQDMHARAHAANVIEKLFLPQWKLQRHVVRQNAERVIQRLVFRAVLRRRWKERNRATDVIRNFFQTKMRYLQKFFKWYVVKIKNAQRLFRRMLQRRDCQVELNYRRARQVEQTYYWKEANKLIQTGAAAPGGGASASSSTGGHNRTISATSSSSAASSPGDRAPSHHHQQQQQQRQTAPRGDRLPERILRRQVRNLVIKRSHEYHRECIAREHKLKEKVLGKQEKSTKSQQEKGLASTWNSGGGLGASGSASPNESALLGGTVSSLSLTGTLTLNAGTGNGIGATNSNNNSGNSGDFAVASAKGTPPTLSLQPPSARPPPTGTAARGSRSRSNSLQAGSFSAASYPASSHPASPLPVAPKLTVTRSSIALGQYKIKKPVFHPLLPIDDCFVALDEACIATAALQDDESWTLHLKYRQQNAASAAAAAGQSRQQHQRSSMTTSFLGSGLGGGNGGGGGSTPPRSPFESNMSSASSASAFSKYQFPMN